MAQVTAELPIEGPYDLDRTLAVLTMGRGNPCLRHDQQRAVIAERTPAGPVVLRVTRREESLEVLAEGDGAEWARPHLAGWLGLEGGSYRFKPGGRLRRLAIKHAGMRLPRLPVVSARLVQVVLQQLITFRDACRGWRQLVQRFGEPAPAGDGLYLPPDSATLARLPTQHYIECEVLPRHARVIRHLAQHAVAIERLWAAGASEGAIDRLSEFLLRQSGVGPWTVGYLRGAGLGDADAVVLGDYGHPHHVAYFFTGEERGDDEQMLALLEPYRPNRFRTLMLLILGAPTPPRRGPRREPLRRRMR